jgi:hypothetical protein
MMTNQSISRSWKKGVIPALLFALLTPVSHATETVIYKWVDKNGVVSYSQAEPSGQYDRDITTIKVETLPLSQQRAASRMLANLEKSTDAEYLARQKRLKAADATIDAALQRLQRAERRLGDGSIATGYDRIGNVGGHARLRDSYFNRVEKLQADVEQAKQALDNAYAARDQI